VKAGGKPVTTKASSPQAGVEGDERYSALLSNVNAVRAVASAVEGTIGQV
jgi:hypothetical protein